MITISSNIKLVAENIKQKLELLKNKEYLLRPIALDVIDLMTKRIHLDGIASDGGPIGTYSPEYMKVRTGNFGNSGRFSRGAKKGQAKNAGVFTSRTIRLNKQTGVFTGEEKVGKPRPQYNRSSDTKIIVSLTRQLENDWAVVATEQGYGISFLNPFNLQKMKWVEEIKKKKISALTDSEQKFVNEQLDKKIAETLNGAAA